MKKGSSRDLRINDPTFPAKNGDNTISPKSGSQSKIGTSNQIDNMILNR